MCAAKSSIPLNQNPSSNSNLPVKTRPTTGGTSPSMRSTRDSKTSPKPQQSREQKRKNWAKRSKPVAKPSVRVGPVKVYTSVCCSLPAQKPRAGAVDAVKDPETGKTKDKPKGLGHWHCSGCHRACKVTVGKPEAKETFDAKLIAAADLVIAEVAQ